MSKIPPANIVERQGSLEKLELTVEGDVKIPALLHLPAGTPRRAVLFVSSFGKSNDPDIAELTRAGAIVLAVDPRGMGESYQPPTRTGYSQAYQLAARAMLLGRNLVEMQVADLLAAARYLGSRPEAAGKPVALVAKGSTGPAGLMAAAVSASFQEVVLERSILSYQSVVDEQVHQELERTVVPGILQYLDLPDVMQLVAPRRLTVVSPIRPNGTPLLEKEAKAQMGSIPPTERVTLRGEGWSLDRVLPDWF